MFEIPNVNTILMGLLTVAFPFLGPCLMGCDSAPTINETLILLKEGKFQGDLTITSDGRVSFGVSTHTGIGAEKSAIAAHGTVNFGDQVRVSGIDDLPEGGDFAPDVVDDDTSGGSDPG